MPLFEELKRRKVIRVGLAYLVVAWLVVQVAERVADSLGKFNSSAERRAGL